MRRAIIPALLLVLVSVVLGATVFREQVAHAAATLMVREQNLDANGNIKVHEQGTGNVTVVGDVRTRAVVPTGAFSLHLDPAPRLVASGPDPAGTDYAITSITAANDTDSPDHVHIHAFYGGASLNCATGTGVQDLSDGPTIEVPARSTVHLDFPQADVLTAGAGDEGCLVVDQGVGAEVYFTIDGYRF
jgi:hypothetical protein